MLVAVRWLLSLARAAATCSARSSVAVFVGLVVMAALRVWTAVDTRESNVFPLKCKIVKLIPSGKVTTEMITSTAKLQWSRYNYCLCILYHTCTHLHSQGCFLDTRHLSKCLSKSSTLGPL